MAPRFSPHAYPEASHKCPARSQPGKSSFPQNAGNRGCGVSLKLSCRTCPARRSSCGSPFGGPAAVAPTMSKQSPWQHLWNGGVLAPARLRTVLKVASAPDPETRRIVTTSRSVLACCRSVGSARTYTLPAACVTSPADQRRVALGCGEVATNGLGRTPRFSLGAA